MENTGHMYTTKQIKDLKQGFIDCMKAAYRLHVKGDEFLSRLSNEKAGELMLHGFLRRLATLQRCIENIYRLNPLEKIDMLTPDDRKDLEINLQAFVFNIFGALDNLALVTVHELEIKISSGRVGFLKEEIDEMLSNVLSEGFRNYINSKELSEWKIYMRDFRHALGHRIPFYVPPSALNESEVRRHNEIEDELAKALEMFDIELYQKLANEQSSLGRNFPIITHSFSEGSKQVFFHSQVLADCNTVMEIATKFIDEFDAFKVSPKER